MLHLSLITLALFGGILVEPFRVAEAEPGHHQVHLRVAMAPDGHFAIAWVDSLELPMYEYEMDMYVRFFDPDGNPLTDAYKITKLVDTNWIYWPCLDMDSLGNTALVWIDNKTQSDEWLSNIRFQRFTPDGNPAVSALTLREQTRISGWRPIGASLNNNGEFALAWSEDIYVWVQRFDLDGTPQDSVFLAHDSLESWPPYFFYPQVALNDAGDLIVTWLDFTKTMKMYPRFQMFDAQDEFILPWDPMGHRLDDGDTGRNASRSEPFWLDDDRFVVFWTDYYGLYPDLLGRVFSNRGLTSHPVTFLTEDSLGRYGDYPGSFSAAVSSDEHFAYTHTRSYSDYPDTAEPWKLRLWEHGAGILGEVVNNEPWRRTTLFEYTPPWGADTINSYFDNWGHAQAPAVAACDDRIVWVYSRFNTDTIFEAFATISDWDMGVGVVEQPPVTHLSDWQITSSVGYQIVLRYTNHPQGFNASIFDASGRKVGELHSNQTEGTVTWGECYGAGVYFIRVESGSSPSVQKVVLVK